MWNSASVLSFLNAAAQVLFYFSFLSFFHRQFVKIRTSRDDDINNDIASCCINIARK